MKVETVRQINFTGIPVSRVSVKGISNKYGIYDITPADSAFLKDMYNNTDLSKLMPKMNKRYLEVWNQLLEFAVKTANYSGKKAFIGTCNNKPCGILNYSDLGSKFNLNYVVTFPDKVEHRVPYAGQILFNELFGRFIKSNAQKIDLEALIDSPFNPVMKYKKLGFGSVGGDGFYEWMRIYKSRAQDILAKQSMYISSERIINPKDVDLSKVLAL